MSLIYKLRLIFAFIVLVIGYFISVLSFQQWGQSSIKRLTTAGLLLHSQVDCIEFVVELKTTYRSDNKLFDQLLTDPMVSTKTSPIPV